jgi:deoxyribonuclease-4
MLFGAHVSIAGGHKNAPLNAAKIGCEVFQFFTRSPQGGKVVPLTKQIAVEFKDACKAGGQKEWYVHAPYFINFASANNRIYHGSINVVREELERASLLETTFLMAHLGSYKDLGEKDGFVKVVEGLKEMLKGYVGTTQFLIEISAGAGEIIGDTFEEIAEIIHHKELKKFNIGVCYDTQHAFASGYDIRTPATVKKTFDAFDKTIGLDNLKMFHCNDSKPEFNTHKDRHEHIGDGNIGTEGFKNLFSDKRLQDKSFILETEHDKIEQDLIVVKKLREEIYED